MDILRNALEESDTYPHKSRKPLTVRQLRDYIATIPEALLDETLNVSYDNCATDHAFEVGWYVEGGMYVSTRR